MLQAYINIYAIWNWSIPLSGLWRQLANRIPHIFICNQGNIAHLIQVVLEFTCPRFVTFFVSHKYWKAAWAGDRTRALILYLAAHWTARQLSSCVAASVSLSPQVSCDWTALERSLNNDNVSFLSQALLTFKHDTENNLDFDKQASTLSCIALSVEIFLST